MFTDQVHIRRQYAKLSFGDDLTYIKKSAREHEGQREQNIKRSPISLIVFVAILLKNRTVQSCAFWTMNVLWWEGSEEIDRWFSLFLLCLLYNWCTGTLEQFPLAAFCQQDSYFRSLLLIANGIILVGVRGLFDREAWIIPKNLESSSWKTCLLGIAPAAIDYIPLMRTGPSTTTIPSSSSISLGKHIMPYQWTIRKRHDA